MLDKLSLVINVPPDRKYLEEYGEMREDEYRSQVYKYLFKLERATVLCDPHKFGEARNAMIPFTKVDLNPKYFECYDHMLAFLLDMFRYEGLGPEDFKVSRIDVASDIGDISTEVLISVIYIKGIRLKGYNIIKGGTIYGGSNPMFRVYNKVDEIRERLKNNVQIIPYERGMIDSGRKWVRFEVMKKRPGMTLQKVAENPESFVEYFEKIEIFDFPGDGGAGVFQILYKQINRKFREDMEVFKNRRLMEEIKQNYLDSVKEWFSEKEPF